MPFSGMVPWECRDLLGTNAFCQGSNERKRSREKEKVVNPGVALGAVAQLTRVIKKAADAANSCAYGGRFVRCLLETRPLCRVMNRGRVSPWINRPVYLSVVRGSFLRGGLCHETIIEAGVYAR